MRTVYLEELENLREDLLGGGEALYKSAGCAVCHSVDGQKLNCPSWLDLYGSERQFTDGTAAVADAAYIRESIIAPDAKIVAEYNNIMPSYKGKLEEIKIEALTVYIKSLSEAGREELGPDILNPPAKGDGEDVRRGRRSRRAGRSRRPRRLEFRPGGRPAARPFPAPHVPRPFRPARWPSRRPPMTPRPPPPSPRSGRGRPGRRGTRRTTTSRTPAGSCPGWSRSITSGSG